MQNSIFDKAADNVRILTAAMVEKAKSGHPGGSMGGADFVNVLYSKYLITDPDDPMWISRDRFFLDPGHMSPMLYSVLALTGKYTIDELKQYKQSIEQQIKELKIRQKSTAVPQKALREKFIRDNKPLLSQLKSTATSEQEKNNIIRGFVDKIIFNRSTCHADIFFYF